MADELYKPQVDYTSRDYSAIREDLIGLIPNFAPQWTSRDSTDFGIVLLELFSYVGDILNYYIDRAANESFIDLATQRETVLALARLLNYTPDENTAATGNVTFSNSTGSPITIPAKTQVSGTSTIDGSTVLFETNAVATAPAAVGGTPGTVVVGVTQGVSVTNEALGVSSGLADQSFKISSTGVVTSIAAADGTTTAAISVSVGGTPWTRVSTFVLSSATDTVYTTYTDVDGYTFVKFGDGTFGKIPPNGSSITVSYRTASGSFGNVPAGAITQVMAPYPNVTVTNAEGTSGGADSESTDVIRANAPKALSSLNRAVSLADYENLAIQVPGVAKAKAIAPTYNNVTLYVAANGGGAASTALINAVKNFFADKTLPSITLTVVSYSAAFPDVRVTLTTSSIYLNDQVQSEALTALYKYLAYDNVSFNQTITEADIIKVLNEVTGVKNVKVTGMKKKSLASDDTVPTTVSTIYCHVNEVPILAEDNIDITVTGGI